MRIATAEMIRAVSAAWADVPAAPPEDLQLMAWGWGEDSLRAFAGVAPLDVEVDSPGFLACTPLLDLPPRAAATYLGTFLLSLLRSVDGQEHGALYHDVVTRAHVLSCLTQQAFWDRVRPLLTPIMRSSLLGVIAYLASRREFLALTESQLATMRSFAQDSNDDPK